MKLYLLLTFILTSVVFGDEIDFNNDLFPLLKKSPVCCSLFKDFDFHPTHITKDGDEIRAIISHRSKKDFSIKWKYYVTFSLLKGKDESKIIGDILFSAIMNYPCHLQPKEVYSVDESTNLVSRKIKYSKSISIESLKDLQPQTLPSAK